MRVKYKFDGNSHFLSRKRGKWLFEKEEGVIDVQLSDQAAPKA